MQDLEPREQTFSRPGRKSTPPGGLKSQLGPRLALLRIFAGLPCGGIADSRDYLVPVQGHRDKPAQIGNGFFSFQLVKVIPVYRLVGIRAEGLEAPERNVAVDSAAGDNQSCEHSPVVNLHAGFLPEFPDHRGVSVFKVLNFSAYTIEAPSLPCRPGFSNQGNVIAPGIEQKTNNHVFHNLFYQVVNCPSQGFQIFFNVTDIHIARTTQEPPDPSGSVVVVDKRPVQFFQAYFTLAVLSTQHGPISFRGKPVTPPEMAEFSVLGSLRRMVSNSLGFIFTLSANYVPIESRRHRMPSKLRHCLQFFAVRATSHPFKTR